MRLLLRLLLITLTPTVTQRELIKNILKKQSNRYLVKTFAAKTKSECKPRQAVKPKAAPKQMHDPIEHATGIEKREILAHLAGDCDPYHMIWIKRGCGTRDQPNLVPSALDKRLVGCVCGEHSACVNYMWLHLCEPKRCECGFWYELCPVPPL